MKRLLLIRHAKSSWRDATLEDHERPLNKRGRRDAPRLGAAIAARHGAPELMLTSDAARALATVEGILQGMPSDQAAQVVTERCADFYLSGTEAVRRRIATLDESLQCVACVGHNPDWELLASTLCGERIEMTTGNVVTLFTTLPWVEAAWRDGLWTLEEHIKPRHLT